MMSTEGYPTPEQDEMHIRSCIAREVTSAVDVIGTTPWDVDPRPSAAWDEDSHIGQAFGRARTILQGVSYGRGYWQANYGLFSLADPEVSADQHEGTEQLLQLVALSRASLDYGDEHWRLPTPQDIREVIAKMREELGVSEDWENDQRGFHAPKFPGVSYDRIVQAIMGGRLRVGNPQEPTTICYSHVPFLNTKAAGSTRPAAAQSDQVAEAINRVTESLDTERSSLSHEE